MVAAGVVYCAMGFPTMRSHHQRPERVRIARPRTRFDRLRASPVFARFIGGALCSVPGLMLVVALRFAHEVSWDLPRLVLAEAALVALRAGVNVFWVVVAGTGLFLIFGR